MDLEPEPRASADAWKCDWPQTPAEDGPGPSVWAWEHGLPETVETFELLVETFQDRLVRYALRRLGSFSDAEDVVQEVFVRAFAERARHKEVSEVGPYLYRMIANACTDQLRKRGRLRLLMEKMSTKKVRDGGETAFEAGVATEEMRRAEDLLRRLPRAQAEAIRLRVFEGLRLWEIGEVLGCPVDTVSSRLRCGFSKLRGIISQKRGYDDGLL